MVEADKVAYWNEVETKIRDLVESLGALISISCRSSVLEYLGHNELGLALEGICWDLDARQSGITREQWVKIEVLLDQMGYGQSKYRTMVAQLAPDASG